MNALSDWVRVSKAEFANFSSMACAPRHAAFAPSRMRIDVPADVVAGVLRRLLVQVLPVEPELRQVVVGPLARVDAAQVELPAPRDRSRPGSGCGRRPSSRSARRWPCRPSRPACRRGRPATGRPARRTRRRSPRQLSRVDGELGEEVLRVLVDAAEPVGVGELASRPGARDPVAVGERQRLDDRGAVDHDHAVAPGPRRRPG